MIMISYRNLKTTRTIPKKLKRENPDSYFELTMIEGFHFGNWLGPIKMYLTQIFSFVRANQQGENETSRSALGHVYTILKKYVQIRKPFPSDYIILWPT
jgi:hypothetical protein